MTFVPSGGVGTQLCPSSRTPAYHARTTLHAPSIRSRSRPAAVEAWGEAEAGGEAEGSARWESLRAARSRNAAPTRLCQSSAGSSSSKGTRVPSRVPFVSPAVSSPFAGSTELGGSFGGKTSSPHPGRHHEGGAPSSPSGKQRRWRASTAEATRGSTGAAASSPTRRRTSGANRSLGSSSSLMPASARISRSSASSSFPSVLLSPSASRPAVRGLGAASAQEEAEEAARDGDGRGGSRERSGGGGGGATAEGQARRAARGGHRARARARAASGNDAAARERVPRVPPGVFVSPSRVSCMS